MICLGFFQCIGTAYKGAYARKPRLAGVGALFLISE